MPSVKTTITGDGNPKLDSSVEVEFPNTEEGKAEHLVYQNAVNDGVAAVLAKVGQIMSKFRLTGEAPNAAVKEMLDGIGADNFEV